MSIDAKVIDKLAELSRLEFSADAKAEITGDLENIITFISKLSEVNTDGVQPMSSVMTSSIEGEVAYARERNDEVTEENNRESYQQTAPEADMGFYIVPRVVE
ncbi:MAG: Asp-tRNA(Asn)/Glu-tRNA(Gln) amidotransferase subunit GatC [Alphaproteobacteria bacterium]|nr:Asp-tRNA(Asn)/Glu-tRNA(Gln) amidotransferase subunit GatC [Alphaproteobacteria bacterium]MDD9920271.1 Asp-tRNA(Asn)/Glu-tRNA(Gln) amidotransferase subunit GatC [Alphaproteobacteria bacterium]